jgi:hypothetical protein
MYRNASRFMQRETRSDFALDKAMEKDKREAKKEKGNGKKHPSSKRKKEPFTTFKDRKRQIARNAITPAYILAIGPLVSSLNLKPGPLSVELNRRGIKTPEGSDWNKSLASYLLSQI